MEVFEIIAAVLDIWEKSCYWFKWIRGLDNAPLGLICLVFWSFKLTMSRVL